MSKIRGKDTKPELLVRKFLFSIGYRYKLHDSKLPCKPDIVLPKYRTVVQVNGCFWHGHEGCRFFKYPATRTEWWKSKIEKTIQRDENNNKKLNELGWNVITIWECELKDNKENTFKRLIAELK